VPNYAQYTTTKIKSIINYPATNTSLPTLKHAVHEVYQTAMQSSNHTAQYFITYWLHWAYWHDVICHSASKLLGREATVSGLGMDWRNLWVTPPAYFTRVKNLPSFFTRLVKKEWLGICRGYIV